MSSSFPCVSAAIIVVVLHPLCSSNFVEAQSFHPTVQHYHERLLQDRHISLHLWHWHQHHLDHSALRAAKELSVLMPSSLSFCSLFLCPGTILLVGSHFLNCLPILITVSAGCQYSSFLLCSA